MLEQRATPESRLVAVVTGSGQGIGREVAVALARSGYDVALLARTCDRLLSTAREVEGLGRKALVIPGDVASEEDLSRARDSVMEKLGQVDVLVNNAATQGPTLPLEKVDLSAWSLTLRTNLTGPFVCTKAFLPSLVASKQGSVVNVSSVAALRGVALRSPYCASKQGVIGLTKALAKELGPRGVRVNAVCPGPVLTEAVERVVQERSAQLGIPYVESLEITLRAPSLHRPIRIDEVVAVVMFLASPASSGITGQVITVAGGD